MFMEASEHENYLSSASSTVPSILIAACIQPTVRIKLELNFLLRLGVVCLVHAGPFLRALQFY